MGGGVCVCVGGGDCLSCTICVYISMYSCLPTARKIFLSMHTIEYITALHVASCTHLYMQERTFALIIHIRMFLAPCSIYARKIFPLYLYIYNQVHYCSACCFMYTFGNNICSDYTYWLPAPFMQGNYFSLIIHNSCLPHCSTGLVMTLVSTLRVCM